ncbi:S9 family peptidase [Brachybacterium hainanense]|uniref:S9 family peptidase n=1 Tax=Brachybacterium hainanense TaxID=1541174 RepID=A0ABV6R7R0_9MICO
MDDRPLLDLLDAARLSGLMTTDGGRILAKVSRPDAKGTGYRTELVELLGQELVTLTRGSASVGAAAAFEDGTTLFTAKRAGEDGDSAEDAQLWALPLRGEAREIASRPGGFGDLHVGDGVLIAELPVHSQATTEAEHAELSKTRADAKVTAALHTGFPTRYWSADLGPARDLLAVAELPADLLRAAPTPDPQASAGGADDDEPQESVLHFRYVTMPPGRLTGWTADRAGTRALVAMQDSIGELIGVPHLYLLDLTGQEEPRLVRAGTATEEFHPGPFSPDGTLALISREQTWSETASADGKVQVLDLSTGDATDLWPELDRWIDPVWLDDATVVAASDDTGRGSLWIGGLSDPVPRRLAGGPGQPLSFGGVSVAAGKVIASASGVAVAPHPVQVDPADGTLVALPNPAEVLSQSGSLTEVAATALDGTDLRAWLRVPNGEGPHPLVVFAHGGPWGSWNAWTYRWNPEPFVAAGYAVLLPDPAISTGYGQAMIERGQHELGGAPFTDIMALVDATVARGDIDEERTAFSGGSYGGYMANWVAGHTGDRFRCIVTHASLWDTETMGHTTDNSGWDRPMRPQNPKYNPKEYVRDITVPMLVIHGDKDYRVPIAQGHALWYDLLTFSATPKDEQGRTRHRFLYFPDEGHWILGRGNAEVWYRTFLAFLDEHVRGESWDRPATLG